MFTGIITHTGTIISAVQKNDLRVTFACDFADELSVGESVAVNGCCLTVVDKGIRDSALGIGEKNPSNPQSPIPNAYFSADLSAETLRCTAQHWQEGAPVNLERSLKLGDRLDGHIVTGHVDGIATIQTIGQAGGSHVLTLEAPNELSRFIAEKGSVTLDGISLTVNAVRGEEFSVNIIPHTWSHTTLSKKKTGDAVNLEVDIMARYAARLMAS